MGGHRVNGPAPAQEVISPMQEQSSTSRVKRDTGWKRDGKAKGIYWRKRAKGAKSWGFYADGKIHAAATRQDAIDRKAQAGLRKSAGLPAPDTRVLIRDLAEEVREARRGKIRSSSFKSLEHSLDKIILPELGHLKPGQAGPDRIARLIRDLEQRGLSPASIRRYLSALSPIFKLAVRRGIVATSPIALLSDEERPTGGGIRDHYIWSAEEISALIAAAEDLGRRPEARYNYAPLIHLLALTGLRVSEALGLRWSGVDFLEAVLYVRGSWGRDGQLGAPKTKAGERTVPLSPGLVDLLLTLKPEDATDDQFVFESKRGGRPISYWNFRTRGFQRALEKAKLSGNGITIHDLRSAAASILIRQGLTPVEVADVLGHADANITMKVYAKLFDKRDTAARVRAAQGAIKLGP
jgi:integrase